MPLQAPLDPSDSLPVRERMLIFGGPTVGKTTAYWQLARALYDSGSSAQVFVVDTDETSKKFRMSPRYRDLVNVRLYPAVSRTPDDKRVTFEILLDSCREICSLAKPHDWIICDMANAPWREAQTFARLKLKGRRDIAEAAVASLEFRANWDGKGKEPSDIEGWDWGTVNDLYFAFARPILFESLAHTLWCAPGAAWEPRDTLEKDQEKRRMYAIANAKPSGTQKDLIHMVDTTLYLSRTQIGRYMTTLKDREREELVNAPLDNWVDDYLCKIAAWSVV